jgi:cbb3-type cytochrome oxidase subunit 3
MSTIYFIYGLLLIIVFIAVIVYCYHPKRKKDIEAPKYRMLDEDDR